VAYRERRSAVAVNSSSATGAQLHALRLGWCESHGLGNSLRAMANVIGRRAVHAKRVLGVSGPVPLLVCRSPRVSIRGWGRVCILLCTVHVQRSREYVQSRAPWTYDRGIRLPTGTPFCHLIFR
jgi:hypothetical protein